MATTENRNPRGRWHSAYDPKSLLIAVSDVAGRANPDDPRSVSQRQWDSHRAEAAHPEAPSARQICTRLKLSWSEVLRFALDEGRDLEQTLAATSRTDERTLSRREVRFALNRVALELGERSFSMASYTGTCEKLIRADRRRMGAAGLLADMLPPPDKLLRSVEEVESWDDLLVWAGLEPHRHVPEKTALTLQEAFDLFIEISGALPARVDLHHRLRARFGIAIEKWSGSWPELVAQMADDRAARGLETPTERITREQRKQLDIPPERLATLPKSQPRKRWTYELCVMRLADYLTSLPAGKGPSQHDYRSRRKKHGWPAVRTICDHAPWSVMLDAARRMVQTGEIIPLQELLAARDG